MQPFYTYLSQVTQKDITQVVDAMATGAADMRDSEVF